MLFVMFFIMEDSRVLWLRLVPKKSLRLGSNKPLDALFGVNQPKSLGPFQDLIRDFVSQPLLVVGLRVLGVIPLD